LLVEFDST